MLADRVVFAPHLGERFHPRPRPRVEEAELTLIPAFPYSGPLEDVRLKK